MGQALNTKARRRGTLATAAGGTAENWTAGDVWPRHQKTDDTLERILGVWLHGERIAYRAGRLAPDKEKKLNEILPG